jgi:hypothetical protein
MRLADSRAHLATRAETVPYGRFPSMGRRHGDTAATNVTSVVNLLLSRWVVMSPRRRIEEA